jgi:hypothetical protein
MKRNTSNNSKIRHTQTLKVEKDELRRLHGIQITDVHSKIREKKNTHEKRRTNTKEERRRATATQK